MKKSGPKKIKITSDLIAPCGTNCGLCLGYLREKNHCVGCNAKDKNKPPYCSRCKIKNCKYIKRSHIKYCYACENFTCARLKHLDKRYRTRYGMSMIENLDNIKKLGIRQFVKKESARWTCPACGGTICVHRWACLKCGKTRQRKI
jgi:hypothetical protein